MLGLFKESRLLRYVFAIAVATGITVWYQGCGQYTQPLQPNGFGVPTFVGPGSYWQVFVNGNAGVVELVHQPDVFSPVDYVSISTAPHYPTGFTALTINSVGPPTNGAGLGAQTYALQIPGFGFFMAPFGSSGSTLGMTAGACPGADMNIRWIRLRQAIGWSSGLHNGDAFGTMMFSVGSGTVGLLNDFNLESVGSSDSSSDMGTKALTNSLPCTSGVLADGASESYLGANAVFVHTFADDAIYFGMPSGSPVTPVDLAANYAGILYQQNSNTNSPVEITLSASGANVTGTATILSDVSSGVSAGATNPVVTIGNVSLTDPSAVGFLGGTINFGSTDQSLVCLPQLNAGGSTQHLIACAGEDDSAHYLTLVLVSH